MYTIKKPGGSCYPVSNTHPNSSIALNNLGLISAQQGQKALESDPEYIHAYTEQGRVHLELGNIMKRSGCISGP